MDDDELAKDETAIKLFGRTIPLLLLPETLLVEAAAAAEEEEETVFEESAAEDDDVDDEIGSMERASPSDLIGNEAENDESAKDSLGATGTTTIDANTEADVNESTEPNQNSESPTIDDVTTTTTSSKDEEQEQEQDHDQDQNNKTLKKPDKILPCPRCNSMETKFCYYNNYNVNQPRHYCRRCQRYWTAGGIMRNVPIGAGRRKNKNLVVASQCTHHVAAHHHHHGHLPNGTHSNHAVLNFGYDQGRLQEFPDTGKTLTKSKTDDPSNEEQSDDRMQYSHRVHPRPPPPPPPQAWPPYPWNPIQWNSSVSAVALPPSGFQLPFYPPPPPFFWGCTSSVPSVWNVPNPQTFLGKHSRDNNNDVNPENNPKECNPEKCFWVPKPLRIDELGEGARSSIWKTLGIKMEKKSDLVGEKNDFLKTSSSVLQANPAAFSRSLNFRENM